jgi:hypothetical protein
MATFTNIAATTAAVANRFVTTTNMVVGTYTIANASPVWQGGCLVTITHTSVTGTDTLGTITVVGTGLDRQPQTEVMVPLADSVATSTKVFRTVTSATGAGWVINTGNDTIVMGVAAGAYVVAGGGTLNSVIVNATAAATVVISDGARTIATLPSSAVVGNYDYDCDFGGFLKVATTRSTTGPARTVRLSRSPPRHGRTPSSTSAPA